MLEKAIETTKNFLVKFKMAYFLVWELKQILVCIHIYIVTFLRHRTVWTALHLLGTKKTLVFFFFFLFPQHGQLFCCDAMLKMILVGSMKLQTSYHWIRKQILLIYAFYPTAFYATSESTWNSCLKARLNGFNICFNISPTFVERNFGPLNVRSNNVKTC